MPQEKPSQSKKFLSLVITVTGASPDTDLESGLWAFNRTQLRSKWLYNLYIRCVLGPVKRAGAHAHFLGVAYELIESDPQLDRNELLLTLYPTAGSFLELLTGFWFEVLNLTLTMRMTRESELRYRWRVIASSWFVSMLA